MVTLNTEVINKLGIHGRPAANLTMKAKEFESAITIKNLSADNPIPIDAKAIMRIMAAAIKNGNQVEISAEGSDEEQAAQSLVELFETGFGE